MEIIAYFAVIALAFFFLIVRPQRQRFAAHRALITSLQVGDEVVTTGGMHGTIRALDDDTLEIEIAPGVVATFARGAIGRRVDTPVDLDDDPGAGG